MANGQSPSSTSFQRGPYWKGEEEGTIREITLNYRMRKLQKKENGCRIKPCRMNEKGEGGESSLSGGVSSMSAQVCWFCRHKEKKKQAWIDNETFRGPDAEALGWHDLSLRGKRMVDKRNRR